MKAAITMAICGIILAALGGAAFAAFAKPEDAIRYRKAVMTVIGQHFGSIAIVAKGQAPYDRDEVAHNAKVIQALSELPWEAAMVPESYQGDTTLKESVQKEKTRFIDLAQRFESVTQQLVEAAQSGDLNAVKAQFAEVAQNCKDCHSAFRNR